MAIKAVYDEYEFPWYPEDYHADLYNLDTHYTANDFPFYVAEHEGTIVGTGVLAHHPLIRSNSPDQKTILFEDMIRVCATDCSTERLYVHPEARRMGIGRAIMNQILTTAKLRSYIGMEVWTDTRFEEAHKLYLKMGATMVGERLCHDPEQSPEWGLFLPV